MSRKISEKFGGKLTCTFKNDAFILEIKMAELDK